VSLEQLWGSPTRKGRRLKLLSSHFGDTSIFSRNLAAGPLASLLPAAIYSNHHLLRDADSFCWHFLPLRPPASVFVLGSEPASFEPLETGSLFLNFDR